MDEVEGNRAQVSSFVENPTRDWAFEQDRVFLGVALPYLFASMTMGFCLLAVAELEGHDPDENCKHWEIHWFLTLSGGFAIFFGLMKLFSIMLIYVQPCRQKNCCLLAMKNPRVYTAAGIELILLVLGTVVVAKFYGQREAMSEDCQNKLNIVIFLVIYNWTVVPCLFCLCCHVGTISFLCFIYEYLSFSTGLDKEGKRHRIDNK